MISRQEEKSTPKHVKQIQKLIELAKTKYFVPGFGIKSLNTAINFLNSLGSGPDFDRDLTVDEQLEFLKLAVLNKDIMTNFFFGDVFKFVLINTEAFAHSRISALFFKKALGHMIRAELFNRENVTALLKSIDVIGMPGDITKGFMNIFEAHEVGIFSISQQSFLTICKSDPELFQMLSVEAYDLLKANHYLNIEEKGCEHIKPLLTNIVDLAQENLRFILDQKAHSKRIFALLKQAKFVRRYHLVDYNSILSLSDVYKYNATLSTEINTAIFSEILHDRKTINKVFWNFYYSSQENQEQLIEELKPFLPVNGPSNILSQYIFFKEPVETLVPSNNFVSYYFERSEDKSENKDSFNQDVEKYLSTIENLGEYAPLIAADIIKSLGVKDKLLVPKLGRFDKLEEFASQIQWPEKEERYIAMIVPTLKNAEGTPRHATLIVIDLKNETIECIDSLGSGKNSGIHEVEKLMRDIQNLPSPKDEKSSAQLTRALELQQRLRDFKIIIPFPDLKPQQYDQFHCVTHCVANMMGIIAAKEKLNAEKCDPKVKDFIEKAKIDVAKGSGIIKRTREDLIPYAGILHLAAEAHNKNRIADDAVKIRI